MVCLADVPHRQWCRCPTMIAFATAADLAVCYTSVARGRGLAPKLVINKPGQGDAPGRRGRGRSTCRHHRCFIGDSPSRQGCEDTLRQSRGSISDVSSPCFAAGLLTTLISTALGWRRRNQHSTTDSSSVFTPATTTTTCDQALKTYTIMFKTLSILPQPKHSARPTRPEKTNSLGPCVFSGELFFTWPS